MLDAGLESLEMFFLNPRGSHRVSIANLMWKSGVEKRGGGGGGSGGLFALPHPEQSSKSDQRVFGVKETFVKTNWTLLAFLLKACIINCVNKCNEIKDF